MRSRGFTLIELLIATTMLALLAAGGYAALSAGTSSAAKARRYNDMISYGQAALQAMSRDIRAAVLHEKTAMVSLDNEVGGMDADTLDFIAAVPPRLGEDTSGIAGRCEIGYYIENDASTEAAWLLRREDGTLDGDPLEGGAVSLAGPYVAALNAQFYDGTYWQSGWDIAYQEMPVAVSIQITVVDKDEIEKPMVFSTTIPIMAR